MLQNVFVQKRTDLFLKEFYLLRDWLVGINHGSSRESTSCAGISKESNSCHRLGKHRGPHRGKGSIGIQHHFLVLIKVKTSLYTLSIYMYN